MADTEDLEQPRAYQGAQLQGLGTALPHVATRFSSMGLLGVVVVDAARLEDIERAYGSEAHGRCLSALGALVADVAEEQLDGETMVVAGETGRHEIVALVFRGQNDGAFYRDELPRFTTQLGQALQRHGHRVVYPYFRRPPIFGVGYSAVLRNPHFGAATQVRQSLEEARADASLAVGIEARRRRKILVGLVMAGEVSSVYEPIVDVTSRTVFAYEALARGPEGTDLHSPLALFQGAEEEGLLFELDCLCRRSGLQGAEGLPSGTKLFLNVRPTSIHDPNFAPEALIRTLERSQLSPSDVVFEISEQESIHNFDVFKEFRDDYRKLGFRIALDDTGTGYASLQAVIELEPDFIKVDRAFVHDIDKDPARRTLLSALHSVASKFGAQIIAEGLDTLEELETLGELGIPFGQGWLFGKPTPLRSS